MAKDDVYGKSRQIMNRGTAVILPKSRATFDMLGGIYDEEDVEVMTVFSQLPPNELGGLQLPSAPPAGGASRGAAIGSLTQSLRYSDLPSTPMLRAAFKSACSSKPQRRQRKRSPRLLRLSVQPQREQR